MKIQQLLENLWKFVEQEGNEPLKYAVNPSILPFRGSPFGKIKADDIDKKLKSERADVLWFGSNPNSPDSLHRLLWRKPPKRWNDKNSKECEEFEDQYKALKSSREATQDPWHPTNNPKGWDPIQNPKGGWVHYRNGLAGVLDPKWKDNKYPPSLSGVIMANAIPWGSHTLDELLDVLFEFDQELLKKILAFSDQYVAKMIEALNPKLIIVPLSLARNKTLQKINIYKDDNKQKKHRLLLDENAAVGKKEAYEDDKKNDGDKNKRRNFSYFSQQSHGRKWLYVRHPSSLRIPSGAVHNFQDMLTKVFAANLGSE